MFDSYIIHEVHEAIYHPEDTPDLVLPQHLQQRSDTIYRELLIHQRVASERPGEIYL